MAAGYAGARCPAHTARPHGFSTGEVTQKWKPPGETTLRG